jgi:hypothetical protein
VAGVFRAAPLEAFNAGNYKNKNLPPRKRGKYNEIKKKYLIPPARRGRGDVAGAGHACDDARLDCGLRAYKTRHTTPQHWCASLCGILRL